MLSFSNVDMTAVMDRITSNTFVNVMFADGTPNMNLNAPAGSLVVDFVTTANDNESVGPGQTLLFNTGLDGNGVSGFSISK